MLHWLLRWKLIPIALVVLLLIGAIHFTSRPREELSMVESLLRDMLSPLQWVVTRVGRSTRSSVEYVMRIGSLQSGNQELEEKVHHLQQQVIQLAEYRRENQWLR